MNSTSYNIFDLVYHGTNTEMPLIIEWGEITETIDEIFMTFDGMLFLIIFKLIAKMKID